MKVIFLDIDGVLNSNDWYVKTRGIGGYNGGDVDPKCIELINDLIDATGAKIICPHHGGLTMKTLASICMTMAYTVMQL